jgi:phage tail-like protein
MNNRSVLLNQFAGWRPVLQDHMELVDGGASLRLRLLPGATRPLTDAAGTFGGFTTPAGLAIDTHEAIYVVDAADNLIKRFDPCLQAFQTLPCIGGKGNAPRQLNKPSGIAISGKDDLFVADTGNWRVQIFSIKGLALRRILGPYVVSRKEDEIEVEPAVWERTLPQSGLACDAVVSIPAYIWQPRDVAVSCAGWLFVADYNNGLIHVFDPYFCWRRAYDGASANSSALYKPTRIALDGDGRIYIVQQGADHVVVLGPDGKWISDIAAPGDLKGRFCPVAVAVDDQGNLNIADPYTLFQFQPTTGTSFCCMGKASTASAAVADLVFDKQGNPVLATSTGVSQMTSGFIYEPAGTFVSDALDSRIYRCQWHRVVMHGNIATGTQISVETLTSEETKTVAELLNLPDSRWTPSAINSTVASGDWDSLVQSLPGRYLWVRLNFSSDGKASPCIDRLRIHFPRASSLQYLPAIYSQDEPSRQFLDQFLSIFDTMWAIIGNKLTKIASYFDPMATPAAAKDSPSADFLSWLAGWLGLTLDQHWPERRRRLLVKNAWKLYKLRGTPAGLSLHIELYTGIKPQILEHYKLRRWLYSGFGRLGDQSVLWGANIVNRLELNVNSQLGAIQLIDTGDPLHDPFLKEAYQFTVFVPQCGAEPADPQADALTQQTLQRIIELAKPAHTLGYLQLTRPRFRIGIQSFIGKDTVVGGYPRDVVEGKSKLGYDSTLSEPAGQKGPPAFRIGGSRTGQIAQIGTTTLIN